MFNDLKSKTATVKILSECPYVEKLVETVLSPRFVRTESDGFLTVVCFEKDPPDLSVPCIYIGSAPAKLRSGQIYMERPLDIEKFYHAAVEFLDLKNGSENGFAADERRRVAVFEGKEVSLTAKETELFTLLLSRAGECVSREEIENALWKNGVSGNCADVYICYLRKKLEKIAGPGVLISVRGKGYMLKKT